MKQVYIVALLCFSVSLAASSKFTGEEGVKNLVANQLFADSYGAILKGTDTATPANIAKSLVSAMVAIPDRPTKNLLFCKSNAWDFRMGVMSALRVRHKIKDAQGFGRILKATGELNGVPAEKLKVGMGIFNQFAQQYLDGRKAQAEADVANQ